MSTLPVPDPFNLPQKMTRPELEGWILFGIAVAGKGAKQTEQKMAQFLNPPQTLWGPSFTPFKKVNLWIQLGQLDRQLRRVKLGKYKLLNQAYRAAVKLDLDNLTVESLEKVPGIGPKTARMILMYAFPGGDYAVLDTHILKWLRKKGYDVPDATPSGRRYKEIEQIVLKEAKRHRMTPREFDTWIWKQFAKQ